ncbi:hypothetical protein RchiOBHm_Chr2g0171891 [Rosa chinensis]|uniref:Uncharacterized protein n=1 Tax=Rosa chinensis TaxID=74649 RepID=A0A2P6S5H9_ROSCH|nr:hypothetical protein RchiOBHm_Chr2g0171891 [Rosa chinensis]
MKKRNFHSVRKQLFASVPNKSTNSDSPSNENDATDMTESTEDTSRGVDANSWF